MRRPHPSPSPLAGLVALLAVPAAAQSTVLAPTTQVIVPHYRAFAAPQRPRVKIEKVHATVRILGQTARTTLRIDLFNPSPAQEEAVLLLPVPATAAVSEFAFDGPAKEPTARLLPADEARTTYDDIVRRLRDPGLLEFAGARLIRTSVFPLAPGGHSKVQIAYEHVLEGDGDRVDYVLLRSESLEQPVPFAVDVELGAQAPIAMVYSPSHEIETTRVAGQGFRVRLAPTHALTPGSFRLSYLLERSGAPSASLFAYPDPKVGGGYFLLLVGAPAPRSRDRQVREVTLVLDRSGSMAGAKMEQARAAAQQVLEALDDGEAFNVIDYSTTVERFAPQPVRKDRDSLTKVRAYLASLRPIGGTNIHDALLEALRQPRSEGALPLVLFLTDGLPTVGQTGERAIRDLVAAANTAERRVFTFGVGEDVNVPLLDRVAEMTRATSTYVLPTEDVEVKVARVFKKLCGPVLSSPELVTLEADGRASTLRVRERYPQRLPDLFEGDALVVLGQYREESPLRMQLSGKDGADSRRFEFEFDLSKSTTGNAFVPRLWATRRVADLIDQVRQAGATDGRPRAAGIDPFADPRLMELRDEILRLSTEFGILTEYTSFLATEGTQLGDWQTLIGNCQSELSSRAYATRSGLEAINQGLNLKQFGKDQTTLNPSNWFFDGKLARVASTQVQQVCDRAFFKRGNQWIDGRVVTGGNLLPARTIEFGSPEHLALVHRFAQQGRAGTLSLRGEIVLQLDGEVIAIQN